MSHELVGGGSTINPRPDETERAAARSLPPTMALWALAAAAALLLAVYVHVTAPSLRFPADILLFSESDFVASIVKARTSYPQYTDQRNNDSHVYPPGAPLVTYAVASAVGRSESIAFYRVVQVLFALLTGIIAVLACRRLALLVGVWPARGRLIWYAVWLPCLLLAATNRITNPFIARLHPDALGQLLTIAAYWLLLEYINRGSRTLLVVMALAPGLAFLVKQNLVVWAVVYSLYLFMFDPRRSARRWVAVSVASAATIAAVVGAGYLRWGEPFMYWNFEVLSAHPIVLGWSIGHLRAASPYLAIGALGALALPPGRFFVPLLGAWLVWLGLFATAGYTAGIGVHPTHLGPPSVIALLWFLAALPKLWAALVAPSPAGSALLSWLRPAAALVAALAMFEPLGFVRLPVQPLTADAWRYVSEIESQFTGVPADRVLLDVGSWMYLPKSIVMKDRAGSIGDRGGWDIADFSGILERIRRRHYARILVRNLHAPDFWYDFASWSKPSGIRRALLDHYQETTTIRGVPDVGPRSEGFVFGPVSVLEPRAGTPVGAR